MAYTEKNFEVVNSIIKQYGYLEYSVKDAMEVITYSAFRPIVWSWGAKEYINFNNKALIFKVNGLKFKGIVLIALKHDMYQVHFISSNKLKHTINDIFFDQLVYLIDEHIEKQDDYVF